jgi:hypothetical protein
VNILRKYAKSLCEVEITQLMLVLAPASFLGPDSWIGASLQYADRLGDPDVAPKEIQK